MRGVFSHQVWPEVAKQKFQCGHWTKVFLWANFKIWAIQFSAQLFFGRFQKHISQKLKQRPKTCGCLLLQLCGGSSLQVCFLVGCVFRTQVLKRTNCLFFFVFPCFVRATQWSGWESRWENTKEVRIWWRNGSRRTTYFGFILAAAAALVLPFSGTKSPIFTF